MVIARSGLALMRDHTSLPIQVMGSQRATVEKHHLLAFTRKEGGSTSVLENFEAFYQRNHLSIFAYLWRMCGEEQAARDLTQETFLRAWEHFPKISNYDRPESWLFRVATHFALNHLRQRNSHARLLASQADNLGTVSDNGVEQVVERDVILQTLHKLPPRNRAALVLHSVYGLSCAELATALGTSQGAAKLLLWRGREQFRRCYVQEVKQ